MEIKESWASVIVTKILPATNTLGTRIKVRVEHGHDEITRTYPWNHGLNASANHRRAAWLLCEAIGWDHKWIQGTLPGRSRSGCAFVRLD